MVANAANPGAHNLHILLDNTYSMLALELLLYLVNGSFGRTLTTLPLMRVGHCVAEMPNLRDPSVAAIRLQGSNASKCRNKRL